MYKDDLIRFPRFVENKYGTEEDLRLVFLETLDVIADLTGYLTTSNIAIYQKNRMKNLLSEILVNSMRLRVKMPLDERMFIPDRSVFDSCPSDKNWMRLCLNASEGYRRSPNTRGIYFPEHLVSYVFETAKAFDIPMEAIIDWGMER